MNPRDADPLHVQGPDPELRRPGMVIVYVLAAPLIALATVGLVWLVWFR